MDAVILAGGKNTRLAGVVPAYHKPLLVINGETLVARLAKQAMSVVKNDVLYVLVSPHNCNAVMDVVLGQFKIKRNITFVLQQEGMDVADALQEVLRLVRTKKTLLLCGDNYISTEDWSNLDHNLDEYNGIIGTTDVESTGQANRFARLMIDNLSLITGKIATIHEQKFYRCWIGPVIIGTEPTLATLRTAEDRSIIADYLSAPDKSGFFSIPMTVQDIGIPEVLP